MKRNNVCTGTAPPPAGPDAPEPVLITVGAIVHTHAIRGEVRVRLHNPASTSVHAGAEVVLRRGAALERRRVASTRPHTRGLLVRFEGCDSMTAAETLVGAEICVRACDLPPPGANEIYYHELQGMTVVTAAGVALGTVVEIIPTAGNDVVVVRGDGREHLIPLIADVVVEVDRAHRRLVIEPLPGLLEPD